MKQYIDQLTERLIDVSGIIAFFVLWEIAAHVRLIDPQFIPPPSQIVLALEKLAVGGMLFIHIAASLQRTFIGLLLAIAVAIPAGFALAGIFPGLARQFRPLLRLLGQINAFSLFPIFILFFGIGEIAKVSIILWSTLWPVLFTTISGIQQIDPLYIKSAKSMGAGKFTIFRKVILPGAAPVIFTGIRTGSTHAFLMLVAAEMIGAKAGLGWLIQNSAQNSIIPRLFAAMIVIALLGTAMNYLIDYLESNLVSWKDTSDTQA